MTTSSVYLWSFSGHLFYREYLWETAISCRYEVSEFKKFQNVNHQIQWKTIPQTLFIQDQEVAIQRRPFTYNLWKLFLKKLICNEVARCLPATLRTSSFMYFVFIFSKNASRLLLPKRFWKCLSTISFRKYKPDKQKVVLFVIYLFNYDSSKSRFFMLNTEFDGKVLFSTVFIK